MRIRQREDAGAGVHDRYQDWRLPVLAPDAKGRPPAFETALFVRLAEALRDLIERGEAEAPVAIPTFRDGLATMGAMDAIRASSRAGGGTLQPV